MIKHLELTNFRSHEKKTLDFGETVIIIGPNGSGKTNILEAIYFLATARSWRTNHDTELIKWDADFARVKALIENNKDETFEIVVQKPTAEQPARKVVKINDVKKRLAEMLGELPVVLFSPEEIQLVDGPPSMRRRFLDVLLCQMDRKYTLSLIDLVKVLKERNRLLFHIKSGRSKENELEFWDEKLVDLGGFIIQKRTEVIEILNSELAQTYREISGLNEDFKIKYRPSVQPESFNETLVASRDREVESAATLHGPHRDDFVFLLMGRDLSTFGSRGEFRSAVLSLKIAELKFISKSMDKEPMLLLDDIFSELDKNRRTQLLKISGKHQTVMTTTDLEHIDKTLRDKAKVIML